MNEDDIIRAQIHELIRDEIQEGINDYVDQKEESEKSGLGFVEKEDEDELKVNISNTEVERLLKEYKKIKKRQKKSNLHQVKQMGLVDKNGRQLKQD
tara:strand:+ start:129 stop:419 length:291 start_codon:yes stop_codon:yes gene_type:complete